MEVDDDNSTESNLCAIQASVVINNDESEQQKTSTTQNNACQNPLLRMSTFESPYYTKDSENSVIEIDSEYGGETKEVFIEFIMPPTYSDNNFDDFDDFDPDNALIFKDCSIRKQASHSAQSHTRVKRKHYDSDDSDYEFEEIHDTQTATHYDDKYDRDSNLKQLRDDEAKFIESVIIKEYCAKLKRPKLETNHTAAWRLGPARYWFDLLGVPESGDGFDYGFGLADDIKEDEEGSECDGIDEDAFLMVSQVHWEDDIIWDIKETTEKPTNTKDTDWKFASIGKDAVIYKDQPKIIESQSGTFYSDFPVENEDLAYGLWESEIIWDAKAMKKILQPKILELDPSDENIILTIPEDSDPISHDENVESEIKPKNDCTQTKNAKSMLSKAGVIDDEEEQDAPMLHLDPFNISNDVYYMPKSTEKSDDIHQKHMPHSIPVLHLHPSLIPTFMGPNRLRNFHRTPLKKYVRGRLAQPGPHPVLSLAKYIAKKEKIRKESFEAGESFFMRSLEDLSGRDGNLVLIEFSEEHPLLINFIGMCSMIKNYYKRKLGKDTGPPVYKYGETAYPQNNLFLGNLLPGQSIQAIENNMYRAPIYEHKVNETDFLVIRTRNQYYIREIDAIFVAGQECPLIEVPAPKSKKVVDFMKNFLQVFAYKTFAKSNCNPPKIHKDVLKRAFPSLKNTFVKRNLSLCADYNYTKGGPDCFHWVLKPSFRLPLEDEIRLLITPEQCCAYFSMVAAQQRLKDAGYGDKSAFILQDKDVNDEEMQNRLDDEVKAAPWNTTRAYIEAMNGKCCLQLAGSADPTGCGEGFSYVRVSNKAFKQDESELKPKKITGTEADLRYLSGKGAETILRNYGVPLQDIKKLTRWELIDAVRTLSTIREDRGEEGFAKFSRSKRFTMAACQQRYKEECQRIFDLQNRILSSNEVFSSDDEDDYPIEGMGDVEKMAESIESLLISKEKSISQLEFEREEREREELLKMLRNEGAPVKEKPIETKKDENINPNATKTLKIHRTFRNADGSEYTRTEIIRDPGVIDAYLKIRSSKDVAFIKQYANEDEELERERKKIEVELKNIKERKRRKEKLEEKIVNEPVAVQKFTCSSCGQYGHRKSSLICPNHNGAKDKAKVENQELVKVNGTKVKFSMKLIKDSEKVTTSTSAQSKSKEKPSQKQRKRSSGDEQQVDYNKQYQRPAGMNRQRCDPVVLLSTIFEEILTVIRGKKQFQPFLFPINTKVLTDYRRIIGRPMDLQTIRENIRQRKYQSRAEFLADVIQIKDNSTRYNGQTSPLTDSAQKMLNMCVELIAKKEDKIIRLENAIKPLLDDNDQEAFSDMIAMVIKDIKAMPEAISFLKPVNKNLVGAKQYYNIVKNPMDLETISRKIATHKYQNRAQVMADIQLIYNNCVLFNGKKSATKTKAEILLKTVAKRFDDLSHQILHLESSIASVQEKAMRQADIDTSWMYEDAERTKSKFSAESPEDLSDDEVEESAMDADYIDHTENTCSTIKTDPTASSQLNLSDDDSEDSNAGTHCMKRNAQTTVLPTIHETSILEEDLQFSSDDDL